MTGLTQHRVRQANEASIRLNRGNVRIDTIDRMESLVRNIEGKRIAYRELIADEGMASGARS